MKNISFALTTQQFRERTKTVTRRLGWAKLKPGEVLQGVEKCQGLGKGGKVKPLGLIRVVSVQREPLCSMTVNSTTARRRSSGRASHTSRPPPSSRCSASTCAARRCRP